MAFSGKKFIRTGCENVEQLVNSNGDKHLSEMLKLKAPVFSFTRIDDDTFSFELNNENHFLKFCFKLGEETEIKRPDGSKVKVTYTLENDNVLNKEMKFPNGKVVIFRKEYFESENKMIMKVISGNVEASIFYEVVK